MPRSSSSLAGLLHHRHVALRAHHDARPAARRTSSSSNSCSTSVSDWPGALRSLGHPLTPPTLSTARAAMSRRICLPVELDPLRRRVGALAGLGRRRRRAPVTFSTRPPAVTISPSRSAVPGVEHLDVERVDRVAGRVISSPVRRRLRVAARGEHDRHRPVVATTRARTPASPPGRVDASSSSSRSERSRGSTAWVSGSPKRQLNSSTFGPSAVIISPA